jgi:hypothetical protein
VPQKHQKVDEATQIQADDFKLINGITRGIEKHLHAADIQTYAQLASLSPREILSKLGRSKSYSVRRIEEENWIEQARELIPKKVPPKPAKNELSRPVIRQHYENFTIEFLLDDKNWARRTHVVHVQSGDADTWAGWKAEQLFDFIVRHARVRLPRTRSTVASPIKRKLLQPQSTLTEQASSATPETVSLTPVEMSQKNSDRLLSSATASYSKASMLTSTDQVSVKTVPQSMTSKESMTWSTETIPFEWKISLPDTDKALRNLPCDQVFDTRLSLDLSKVSLPERSQLDCTATLHAKKLGGGNRQVIGQIQKILPFENALRLTTRCSPLSPGIYRLEAAVTIRLAGTEAGQQPRLMSFLESSPIQVY